jgi:Diacylglycerol kinase catalytic domain
MTPDAIDTFVGILDHPISEQSSEISSPRRIGIIINPRSHANKARPIQFAAVLARYPALRSASPTSPAALRAALRRFAFEKIDLVVISGGDGTLRDVLSALPASYPDGFPDIAILSSGNTNLAGRVLGSPGRGGRALEWLLKAIDTDKVRRKTCPVLQVSWPGEPARPPVCGFLFGAAAFTEAKRIANESVQSRGVHQALAVAAAMVLTSVRAVLGRGTVLAKGASMQIGIDAAPARNGRRFLMLATTLDSLMLGLWPFWGSGDGSIRWLVVDAPAPRLGAALSGVLLRRPWRWMAKKGYRSGRAEAIAIRMDQPFILDGEAFEAGHGGIVLSTVGSVTVITA